MARTRRDTLQAKRKRGLAPWDWLWMQRVPRWWNDLYHTRPARRAEKALEHKATRGEEPTEWPDHKRPHKYYW
jgi:hypothetical protein